MSAKPAYFTHPAAQMLQHMNLNVTRYHHVSLGTTPVDSESAFNHVRTIHQLIGKWFLEAFR